MLAHLAAGTGRPQNLALSAQESRPAGPVRHVLSDRCAGYRLGVRDAVVSSQRPVLDDAAYVMHVRFPEMGADELAGLA